MASFACFRFRESWGLLACSMVGSILWVRIAQAEVDVHQNTGAAQTSVEVRVPSHHGLEPAVRLNYSSGGGDGLAGVGWHLAGFPYIERQGEDGGAPAYAPSDTHRLGGTDLLPCGASASPGCQAGGTHFLKHENYQRIVYDESAAEWVITSRNGTQTTYTPVWVGKDGTFRWGIHTIADTLGNSVA